MRGVGKKGIEYFNFQGIELLEKHIGVSSSPTYEKAQNIIKSAIDSFLAGETDKVVLVHNGYKNMISQEMRVNDIVPIEPPTVDEKHAANLGSAVEFEPDENAKVLLDELMIKVSNFV